MQEWDSCREEGLMVRKETRGRPLPKDHRALGSSDFETDPFGRNAGLRMPTPPSGPRSDRPRNFSPTQINIAQRVAFLLHDASYKITK